MSGGIAYVLDEERSLYKRLNKELYLGGSDTNTMCLEAHNPIQSMWPIPIQKRGKRIWTISANTSQVQTDCPHDYRRMMNAIDLMEEKAEQ